jgi:hypothetical protein
MELPMPHKHTGVSIAAYSEWMDQLLLSPSGEPFPDRFAAVACPSPLHSNQDTAVWAKTRACLDTYAQRMSSAGGGGGGGGGAGGGARAAEYTWLLANGPTLLTLPRSDAM